METYMENDNLKVVDGYGNHMDKRYEVLRKYFYYDNFKKVESWKLVYHCKDLNSCIEYFNKYKDTQEKSYKLDEIIF